jgi:hypothetical protein
MERLTTLDSLGEQIKASTAGGRALASMKMTSSSGVPAQHGYHDSVICSAFKHFLLTYQS